MLVSACKGQLLRFHLVQEALCGAFMYLAGHLSGHQGYLFARSQKRRQQLTCHMSGYQTVTLDSEYSHIPIQVRGHGH